MTITMQLCCDFSDNFFYFCLVCDLLEKKRENIVVQETCARHVHMHVHRYLYKCVRDSCRDTNAMLLLGHVPGYKDTDVKLLSSSTTKHSIWELCLQAAAANSMRAVAYSTFMQLWHQLLPNSRHETHE